MQMSGHQIVSSMKAPCMSKEQYKGIHDVDNDQGFAMHYRVISNTVSHLEVFRCERINAAKQKDGLTSFLMFNALEAKIIQYDYLERRVKITVTCFGDHMDRDFKPWDGF